jgi:RNA polymerase sigma factor (sigma-70 family)
VPDPTDRVALLTALARLAPLDRAVVVLRFWEDRSVAQTAADLDLSEAAVKNRSLRALRTLRELLAESTHQGSS